MRRTITLHNLGVRDVRQLALFCSEREFIFEPKRMKKMSSPFLTSPVMAIALIAAIAVIVLASNFTIANAQLLPLPLEEQQQQQQLEEQQVEEESSDGGGGG